MTKSNKTTDISTEIVEALEAPEAMNLPALPSVFDGENLKRLFEQVEKQVADEAPDVETEEGRKRIKELAAAVSKSKTAIDKPIRDHLRALKAIPKVLEVNARESLARFDSLRDELLRPLNEAQAEFDSDLEKIKRAATISLEPETTSDQLEKAVVYLKAFDVDQVWPELKKKFKTEIEKSLQMAELALERAIAREEQQAELDRLRQEKEKRDQEERDRKIADEAANQARQEAEAKAQREREAVERRAVEAKQREEEAKAAAEKAKRDAELAKERRKQQEEQSKLDAIEAEKRAKDRAEQAAKEAEARERQRAEEAEEQAKEAAKKREADKEHRIKINRAALVALIAEGIGEDDAKKAITAIAKGLVPSVKIFY